jgi:hypothetical protein
MSKNTYLAVLLDLTARDVKATLANPLTLSPLSAKIYPSE